MEFGLRHLPFLDLAHRYDAIQELWPDFPQLVMAKFNQLWRGNDFYKRKAKGRYEAFRSRAEPSLPIPKFLGWEREIFEVAFQSVLQDLRLELWKQGKPFEELLEQAADTAIPSVRMDIALELSSAPRPQLTRPHLVDDEIIDAAAIQRDSELNDWIRIGYHEEELLNKDFDEGTTVSRIALSAGLVAFDIEAEIMRIRIPFAPADEAIVWKSATDYWHPLFAPLHGKLICGFFHHGHTVQTFALACHSSVIAALRLQYRRWPGPIQMLDERGDLALVARFWKTDLVDGDTVGNVFRLVGCELLLRSDLFEVLERRTKHILRMVYRKNPA